ncbi:MAG: gluconokinase, GntK/IdnK-type [Myxococcota bacterium]
METKRIVVMGPSASGKTVVGQALAERLGLPFEDADAHHAPESVAKMGRGEPLGEDDRAPWLATLAELLRGSEGLVLACSALGRAHRDALRVGDVRFVYLETPEEVLAARLRARDGHFAGIELLPSQLDTLAPPGPDEPDVLTVDGHGTVGEVRERARRALG